MKGKRTRKPPTSTEKRAEWLKRYERNGETPPQIADEDDVDVRTVRKHLDLAQRERDMREARTTLLRDALRDHYHDMHAVIKLIEASLLSEQCFDVDNTKDLRIEALRQHMPRSPLFQNVRKFNNGINEMAEINDDAKYKISTSTKEKINKSAIGTEQLKEGLVNVLVYQIEQWSRGHKGLNVEENFSIESRDNSTWTVRYGFSHLGKIEGKDVETLKKMIKDFELDMRDWEELKKLQSEYNKLKSVRERVLKEIAGLHMRRIFTGKCEFCPL